MSLSKPAGQQSHDPCSIIEQRTGHKRRLRVIVLPLFATGAIVPDLNNLLLDPLSVSDREALKASSQANPSA
jgi:hypothetical protein